MCFGRNIIWLRLRKQPAAERCWLVLPERARQSVQATREDVAMLDSSYPGHGTFLAPCSLSSTELLILRAALCRARARSIREAWCSRSISQTWDMIRSVWEVDRLVEDVNCELARCLPIWPDRPTHSRSALHVRAGRSGRKQSSIQAKPLRTHAAAAGGVVAGPVSEHAELSRQDQPTRRSFTVLPRRVSDL
jgi:hypothetical protein